MPFTKVIFSNAFSLPCFSKGEKPVVFKDNTVFLEEEIKMPNNNNPKPICAIDAPAFFIFPFTPVNI